MICIIVGIYQSVQNFCVLFLFDFHILYCIQTAENVEAVALFLLCQILCDCYIAT